MEKAMEKIEETIIQKIESMVGSINEHVRRSYKLCTDIDEQLLGEKPELPDESIGDKKAQSGRLNELYYTLTDIEAITAKCEAKLLKISNATIS